MFFILELIGTVAFAISGASVALEKKMDIFGVAILGMTTAVGGGIMRDLIIGVIPPTAFQRPVYALTALATSVIVFLPFVRKHLSTDSVILLVMDSLGLGIFTVTGVMTCASLNNVFLQIFVGTLTGVGGGVLRDIFAGIRPSIFVKHFYATASLIGALVCSLLIPLGQDISMIIGAFVVTVLRLLAAKYRWNLPH